MSDQCQVCGEQLEKWHGDIYECPECGNMFDSEVLEEVAE